MLHYKNHLLWPRQLGGLCVFCGRVLWCFRLMYANATVHLVVGILSLRLARLCGFA